MAMMKVRKVKVPGCRQVFLCPAGIQRIDSASTHGWQLRYGGKTKLFSDFSNDGKGAPVSFQKATKELLYRIERVAAPSRLRSDPLAHKTSDLPVGISGPLVRLRKGSKVRECNFSVSLPRYGEKPQRRTVYIGNENTYTVERYHAALERAVDMRTRAERAYQTAATKAKRVEGRKLLAAA
jgi:hypothetical protein